MGEQLLYNASTDKGKSKELGRDRELHLLYIHLIASIPAREGRQDAALGGSAFSRFDVTRHDDERFWIHQPLAVGHTRIDGDHEGVYHRAELVRAGLCIDLHRRRQDRFVDPHGEIAAMLEAETRWTRSFNLIHPYPLAAQ